MRVLTTIIIPCDDWEIIYTLSYYHNQIGSMNYYPLFRVRSWNNGMRCISFYILMGSVIEDKDSKATTNRIDVSFIHVCANELSRHLYLLVCRLFDAKPLHKSMLLCCQLEPCGKLQWNFIRIRNFLFKKMHLKILFENCGQFCRRSHCINRPTTI